MRISTTAPTTQVMTTDSGSNINNFDTILAVSAVMLFGLLATVVALLLLVYYKRKRSGLVNLIKSHKGSEENSYASSEHSHQQGSKYSESPEPGYDVIKTMHTKNVKAKIFPPKRKSTHLLDKNPTHTSEYTSIKDNDCDILHYSEISSVHKTTGSHILTKDNLSMNSHKCGEMKQEVVFTDSEIAKGEASPIPPQTIKMMYTAVQKQPKVSAGMDSEFEDSTPPPPPSQTTEMMYTAVQKRPKDSILAEAEDDVPPVSPYMEKEDKETEATAKGSDEGSPPPVPPQTTEMLYTDL